MASVFISAVDTEIGNVILCCFLISASSFYVVAQPSGYRTAHLDGNTSYHVKEPHTPTFKSNNTYQGSYLARSDRLSSTTTSQSSVMDKYASGFGAIGNAKFYLFASVNDIA